jgi:hypothetical protein
MKSILLIILFFTACKSDITTEDPPIPQPNPLDTNLLPHVTVEDTIVSNIFFENISNTFGNFGVTISEWNKHLAMLAKNNEVINLNESGSTFYYSFDNNTKNFLSENIYSKVYEADLPFDDNLLIKINGIFRFPINYSDTFEVFLRENIRLSEPVLVGIKLNYYLKQNNSHLSSIIPGNWMELLIGMIENDKNNFEYVAGEKISSFNNGNDYKSYYNSYILDAHNPIKRGLDSLFGRSTNEPMYHQHKLNSKSKYSTLYKTDNYFSIINVEHKIEADLNCSFKNGSNSDCELISADNENSYYFLSEIWLSKKQSGINTNDFYTESQKNSLERKNKQKELINKALEGN